MTNFSPGGSDQDAMAPRDPSARDVTAPLPVKGYHRGIFLLTAVLIVGFDILTKYLIVQSMDLYDSYRVFGDYVKITYILNPGAAFGLFPGNRWPLIAVSVVAILVVVWVAFTRRTTTLTVLALGLVLGGAVGNLIDRIRLGEVIDFINVGFGSHRWPVFNVADSAVTVGVLWLALGLARPHSARTSDSEGPHLQGDAPRAGVAAPGDDG